MANPFDQFDAANPFDQFDAPDMMDVPKSAGTGIEKGLASIVGLPGDVREAGASLIERVTGKTLPTIPGWVKGIVPGLHSSSDYMAPLQSAGLVHEPQTLPGKIAERVGEFAPAALQPETLMGKLAATALPAVAGPLAAEGAAQSGLADPQTADMAVTLLSPFAGNRGVKSVLTMLQSKAAPTTQALRTAERSTYALANATGTVVHKPAMGQFLNSMLTDITNRVNLDDIPKVNPVGASNIRLITRALNNPSDITLQRLHDWRREAGKAVGPNDAKGINSMLYAGLSKFMDSPPKGAFIGPNSTQAAAMLKAGDALHKRYKNSQLMDQMFKQASNREANSTNSMSGETLGLNQKFRSLSDQLAKPDSRLNKFVTPEQSAAVDAVVHPSLTRKALKAAGSFHPLGMKGMLAMMAPGAGTALLGHGPLASAAFPAALATVATASKVGEHFLTKAAARKAAAMFRTGKPMPEIVVRYPELLPLLARGSFPGLLGLDQPDQP